MKLLTEAQRIVLKIGSSLLVESSSGQVHQNWLAGLAADISSLQEQGKEVLIVSSGAIALGRRYLGIKSRPLRLEESQAAAAAGQSILTHAYQEVLGPYNLRIAQVLLTVDDTEQRRKYLNARNTINTLLKLKVVPIINENDTVATTEIRFGDNDRLSAQVAAMMSADCLILLSDVEGLFASDPRVDPNASFIDTVKEITPQIEAMAGVTRGDGTGGMIAKLLAAKIATSAGCTMIIAKGSLHRPVANILEGNRTTLFEAQGNPRTARKQWIAAALKPLGSITVDKGAEQALLAGKSLLPAGVVLIQGVFSRGDPITVKNLSGGILAQGLSAYSSQDAHLILGHKSREIESLLGYRGRDEMIHRDDLALS